MTIDLVARAEATEAMLRRFRNRPFDWKAGATCLHLLRGQLIKLGHKPPRIPQFRSALGAQRALEKAGFATLEELIDSLLPRIAPAQMLVGDVAMLPGEAPFGAVVISAGNKLIGWHEADLSGLQVIAEVKMTDIVAAWRV